MKKILFMALLLFGCVGVFAQERTIEQAEFDAIYKNSFGKWGKSYRMTVTTQSRVEGRPQTDYSSKTTIEFALPTGSRSIIESSFGGKSVKTEMIRMADRTYTRKDGEAWMKQSSEVKSPPNVPLSGSETDNQTGYKYFGSEQLNDQTARGCYELLK